MDFKILHIDIKWVIVTIDQKKADSTDPDSQAQQNTQTQDLSQPIESIISHNNDTWFLFQNSKVFLQPNKNEEKQEIEEQEIGTKEFLRKDKSYKNVFRAPKKYFLDLFKKNFKFFEIKSTSERKKVAQSEIENFVRKFIINMDYQNTLDGLTVDDLVNLVGRIVIPTYMQKNIRTYVYRKEWELLHDWIYRYNSFCASKLYQSKYSFKYILIIIKYNFFLIMLDYN